VDNFDNPWSYEIIEERNKFEKYMAQTYKIGHHYTELETNARSFGLTEGTTVEKKLTANPWIGTKYTDVFDPTQITHFFYFVAQKKHISVSRSYITFLDAAGNVGG
jgi:hypothetical protein